MRLTYDPDADAFLLALVPDAAVAETIDQGRGVYVDVDRQGKVLAVEIIEASRHLDRKSLALLKSPVNYLSLAKAGDASGLSPGTLRVLLNNGRLEGEKRGRDWVVTESALVNYLESRHPAGRPAANRKARRAPTTKRR